MSESRGVEPLPKILTLNRTPANVPEVVQIFDRVSFDVTNDQDFQEMAKRLKKNGTSPEKIELILQKTQEIVNKILRRRIFSAIRSESTQADLFEVDTTKYENLLEDITKIESFKRSLDEEKSYFFSLATQMVESNYYDVLTKEQEGLSKKGLELRYQLEKNKFDQEGKEDECLVLVEFDINSFKAINDNIGHANADTILKEIIEKLRKNLRESDAVGRRSGDEFTVLLTHVKITSVDPLLRKISEVVSTIENGIGGSVSITGGARIIHRGAGITFSEASQTADFAGIYEKINKPEEVDSSIKIYEPGLHPDLSSETARRLWAEKVARRELKRERDRIVVRYNRETNPSIKNILEQQLDLLNRETELRIERKYWELTEKYQLKIENEPTEPFATSHPPETRP